MDHDPRQSIHEIGVARKLVLSSAKPSIVALGSFFKVATPTALESIVEEVGHDVGGKRKRPEKPEGKLVPVLRVWHGPLLTGSYL